MLRLAWFLSLVLSSKPTLYLPSGLHILSTSARDTFHPSQSFHTPPSDTHVPQAFSLPLRPFNESISLPILSLLGRRSSTRSREHALMACVSRTGGSASLDLIRASLDTCSAPYHHLHRSVLTARLCYHVGRMYWWSWTARLSFSAPLVLKHSKTSCYR